MARQSIAKWLAIQYDRSHAGGKAQETEMHNAASPELYIIHRTHAVAGLTTAAALRGVQAQVARTKAEQQHFSDERHALFDYARSLATKEMAR